MGMEKQEKGLLRYCCNEGFKWISGKYIKNLSGIQQMLGSRRYARQQSYSASGLEVAKVAIEYLLEQE